jgi:hypothetical protein
MGGAKRIRARKYIDEGKALRNIRAIFWSTTAFAEKFDVMMKKSLILEKVKFLI